MPIGVPDLRRFTLQGQGTQLRPLIEGTLIGQRNIFNRVQVSGPDVVLNPKAAQAVGLALHELTTNSMKYGALSSEAGGISIQWQTRRAPRQGRRINHSTES